MQLMGFFKQVATQSEMQAYEQIWKFLNKDDSETIGLGNLKVFMCAILNFSFPFMKSQSEEEEGHQRLDRENIGRYEEDRYCLREDEIIFVAKHFCLLQANRQDHLLDSKKQAHRERTIAQTRQEQFKPTTCKASKKILESKNPKEQMGEGISYHDYLI